MNMRASGQWSVVSGQLNRLGARAPRRAAPLATGRRPLPAAFSMTELLIVIGIIVLVLAVAMPAFNLITGAKSNEIAINQISAFLARARNEAIGVQEPRGVFFYLDPRSQRVSMTIVRPSPDGLPPETMPNRRADRDDLGQPKDVIYLDALVGVDPVLLPRGIGIQFIDDGGPRNSSVETDRYIGFNSYNAHPGARPLAAAYGGIILFDAQGKLMHRRYALQAVKHHPTTGAVLSYSPLGRLLYGDDENLLANTRDVWLVHRLDANDWRGVKSQLGFVLFDLDAFKNQFGGDEAMSDWQITQKGTLQAERMKEDWLDANAVPVLINRYNGTIVKGE